MDEHNRVLVAYGTKHGATREIAETICDHLRSVGLLVDIERAGRVRELDSYRAVVLGSAVYAGRWRRDAMRLIRRPELGQRDVWLFSSGPVGEAPADPKRAERFTRPPRVQAIADQIGAHDHVVFGGRVDEDAGFVRKKMARSMPEELRDLRDWAEIVAWAESIAAVLNPTATPTESGDGGAEGRRAVAEHQRAVRHEHVLDR